nr:DUF4238 domain-containing protein [Flavobacterium agrisoli]
MNKKLKITFDKYSKRHHYLPVFYLKGFADQDKLINVYDKIRDIIIPKQNPESKFYEKDLNNYKVDGKIHFTLEEPMFSPIDSRVSRLFSKIQNPDITNYHFNTTEQLEVLHFISQLFWRSPDTNSIFLDLIKKEGLSNKYFGFKKKDNNRFASDQEIPEIKEHVLNDPEIQKMLKHMIPLSDGNKEELLKLMEKWKIFTIDVPANNFITGDNPFLINNDDIRLDNVFNELIFPLTKNKLLVLSDKSPNFLDGLFLANTNISILNQAKRFIASDSEEGLKRTIFHYKELLKIKQSDTILKSTFEFMYHQASFNNHSDYLNKSEFVNNPKINLG